MTAVVPVPVETEEFRALDAYWRAADRAGDLEQGLPNHIVLHKRYIETYADGPQEITDSTRGVAT